MVGIIGLDHVQIAAPRGCEADARRFYGALLGLVEIEKPETLRGRGGVWFGCGEQQLHVGSRMGFRLRGRLIQRFVSPMGSSTR